MPELPADAERLLRERAWLTALARRLVRGDEVAEEAAHDALTAAVVQGLPAGAGPRRWLAAILEKQLAGGRRAAHRRTRREQLATTDAPAPPAADVVARFEVQRAVADAVVGLPEPYRVCVLLRFWEGLPPRRVAAQLRVPVETVRTRLKRGLAMLRERLDAVHGGDRRAWAVPLAIVARPLGSVSSAALVVTLMTTLQKVGALAVVAIAAAFSLSLLWPADVPPDPEAARVDAAQPVAGASLGRDVAGAAEPVQRALVEVGAPDDTLTFFGSVVDDATGLPLAGAIVELVVRGRANTVVASGRSDVAGAFLLRDETTPLEALRRVVVRAEDYAVAVRDLPRAEAAVDGPLDAGTFRCVRGTRYAGRVVDAEGLPVVGATLLQPTENFGYGGYGPQMMLARAAAVGNAGLDGRFSLPTPVAPGYERHGDLLFAVADAGIGWIAIEPSRTRRTIDDLVLRLRANASLRVAVLGPGGRAVPDADVAVMPRFRPLGLQHGGSWPDGVDAAVLDRFTSRVDAFGVATFPRLPIGEPDAVSGRDAERRYQVRVAATGYPEQVPTDVLLDVERRVDVEVRLVADRPLELRVDVRDDTGAPVAGASVVARGASSTTQQTDEHGRANLVVSAVDSVTVVAEHEGHAAATASMVPTTGNQEPVRLVIARTCELLGHLVDQHGAGIAGFSVFHDGRKVASTDERGAFRVEAFPMGRQSLVVAMPSGGDPTVWLGGNGPTEVDAAVGPVTIVWQRRAGSADVAIAVVDAASGGPLEVLEAQLRQFLPAHDRYLLQKPIRVELGRVVATGVVAGRWRLDVRAIDGRRGSLPFELLASEKSRELLLPLTPPGTVTGRLHFVGVEPPETVLLQVAHANADPSAYVSFRYPGRWRVDERGQRVRDDQHGATGRLSMRPREDATFCLGDADADDEIVFTAIGDGVQGTARVRLEPGAVRDLVIEVRAK